MHPLRRSGASLLTLLALSLSGCLATQTPRTPHHLDPGEVVISGGLDGWGASISPRAHAQAMVGLGPGDVSLHGGVTFSAFDGGAGVRLYPSSRLSLGLQGDYYSSLTPYTDSDFVFLDNGQMISATASLITTPNRHALYYGALLTGAHTRISYKERVSDDVILNEEIQTLGLGGMIGLSFDLREPMILPSARKRLQLELTLYPVGISSPRVHRYLGVDTRLFGTGIYVAQLSAALSLGFNAKRDDIPTSLDDEP